MTVHVEKFENVDEDVSVKTPEEESLLPEQKEDSGEKPISDTKENGDVKESVEDGLGEVYNGGRRLTDIAEELHLQGSEETTCGIWCIRGSFLQKFANKKAYVVLYGLLGCIMGSSHAYLNGTITTLEKTFKIPSTNTGIIMVGGDISMLALGLILNYYGGKGHRPRWIALGVYTVVIYCLLNALPHFLYGPNPDSLSLTEEFGGQHDSNVTALLIEKQNRKSLCQKEEGECDDTTGNFAPQVILFIAQLICGVGGSLYYTLGVSYMDDNIQQTKTPALASFSFFLRMLGPAIGYSIASACLSLYVSPSLTPTITTKDPRWIGAWWLGWLIIGALLFVWASVVALFPRSLPRAAARRILASERRKLAPGDKNQDDIQSDGKTPEDIAHISIKDLKKTIVRLVTNPTLMCNNLASVFYFMGYMPYWVFMPKYIETIYKQSASTSSLITGTLGLAFSAIGILASGLFISKFRPSARFLAAWNVLVSTISVVGIVSYVFLGCPVNDRQGAMLDSGQMETTTPCNADCHCDYVKYTPVCSPDGRTFISPCHAGCRDFRTVSKGSKVYLDCACAPRPHLALALSSQNFSLDSPQSEKVDDSWVLTQGACPIDCTTNFYTFLAIVCLLKFAGATGKTSNFLVSIRCVDEKDKTVSMGLGLMFMSLFAFIPSPILFGHFIDKTCMVWGKTCAGTGNCWLYNAEMLRYIMNFAAAGFISIGTFFDFGVWYYVKDLKIFNEEVEMNVSPQRTKTQRK